MQITPVQTTLIGGTGMIGRALAARLVSEAQGRAGAVRVLVRRRAKAHALLTLPGIEIVEVDLRDEHALEQAIAGSGAVVNLVGVLQSSSGRPWGKEFDEAHVKLPARIGKAMLRAGVRRLVHIGALGVSEQAPSMYLRSKAAGEASLRGLRELQLTVLRPSVVFGPEDQFTRLFARLMAIAPIMPLATPHAQFQPVAIHDVVTAIVSCLRKPETIGKTYELAGPEVLTLYEIVHWVGIYSGHPRPILPLPDALSWLQAVIMEMLPGTPLMSRDNLASASVPNIAQAPLAPELGIGEPTSLHALGPNYLGGDTPRDRLLERRRTSRKHRSSL